MPLAALGAIAATQLGSAREQAHWAVQVIAAFGETFAPRAPDTSHQALRWLEGHRALGGVELAGRYPCRLALRVADLTLQLVDRQGAPHAELGLAGRTLAEAYAFAGDAVAAHTRGEYRARLRPPGFELPKHALADGARFERDAGLPELARWFEAADLLLGEHVARARRGSAVTCWPHHFDVASLIELRAGASVGFGMTPGDTETPEPYWYVNHTPRSAKAMLPPLAVGVWVNTTWTGAVLRGSEVVAAGDAHAQRALVERFLASAIEANQASVA